MFDFASLPLEVARPIYPTMFTKVAVKSSSLSSRRCAESEDLPKPSLDHYDLIPINEIPITGSYMHYKLNKLNAVTMGRDSLEK